MERRSGDPGGIDKAGDFGGTRAQQGGMARCSKMLAVEMPSDFPTELHDKVNETVGRYGHSDQRVLNEYIGGWKAVAIRFNTAARADEAFTESFKRGDAIGEERLLQEEALFSFL
jgi:hypothetical protein